MNFYYVQGTRKETKECLKIPRATPGNVCMSSVLEEVEHLSQSLAVGCTQWFPSGVDSVERTKQGGGRVTTVEKPGPQPGDQGQRQQQ